MMTKFEVRSLIEEMILVYGALRYMPRWFNSGCLKHWEVYRLYQQRCLIKRRIHLWREHKMLLCCTWIIRYLMKLLKMIRLPSYGWSWKVHIWRNLLQVTCILKKWLLTLQMEEGTSIKGRRDEFNKIVMDLRNIGVRIDEDQVIETSGSHL